MARKGPYGVAGRKALQSRAGSSQAADHGNQNNVQAEELGEVVDNSIEGADGRLPVRPLEVTSLKSITIDGVEIIQID